LEKNGLIEHPLRFSPWQ